MICNRGQRLAHSDTNKCLNVWVNGWMWGFYKALWGVVMMLQQCEISAFQVCILSASEFTILQRLLQKLSYKALANSHWQSISHETWLYCSRTVTSQWVSQRWRTEWKISKACAVTCPIMWKTHVFTLLVPVSPTKFRLMGDLDVFPNVSRLSAPLQEADDGVLQPAEDVCCDQGQLAAGQGAVVRRGVLSFAHRQQRDPLAPCAGTWTIWRNLKKKKKEQMFF